MTGITIIMELIARGEAPIIMAGSGVRAANLPRLLAAGVQEVHSAAATRLDSPMRYRNPELSMSGDARADEYSRRVVDGAEVARMKAIIRRRSAS